MSNRLRELRKAQGLTIEKLSKELKNKGTNISASAIQKYEQEKRKPKIEALEKLANYFGVSVDYLRGTEPYGMYVYVYIHMYCDLSFLVVANSIEKADEMVLNKIDWDDELENFNVITYPVDEPMIDEI